MRELLRSEAWVGMLSSAVGGLAIVLLLKFGGAALPGAVITGLIIAFFIPAFCYIISEVLK